MFLKNDLITIRDLTKEDLSFMLKWLTNDKVLKYYEGRDTHFTIESISNKFLTDIPNGFRLIIEYKNIPIGYCQYYQLNENVPVLILHHCNSVKRPDDSRRMDK